MKRSLMLLGMLAACSGPESAKKLYAYEYAFLDDQESSTEIRVYGGGAEHWRDQWASRKLKEFDPYYPIYGFSNDEDLDGDDDLLTSTVAEPDGTFMVYGDFDADGETDSTSLFNALFQLVEQYSDGVRTSRSYDGEDRLVSSETTYGTSVSNDYYSYQPDRPDWVGHTYESGSVTEIVQTIVDRRELNGNGRWTSWYRKVNDGVEELVFSRTLDDRDREVEYTEHTGDAELVRKTTYDGDFWIEREATRDGEPLWKERRTLDEEGYPTVWEVDEDGDGIFDTSSTTTYDVDDYGRVVFEEIVDDESGEVEYRSERTDLGLADEADLDPWKVQPRAIDDYQAP